jgi:two-component system response regulator ChvI
VFGWNYWRRSQWDELILEYPSTDRIASAITSGKHIDPSSSPRVDEEISFTRSQNYCISFVDIVNSTQVTSNIESPEKVRKYYEIFLNTMATIARNYGAKIVKNVGDCLIFYFPETSDHNEYSFKNVLECSMTIQEAQATINEKLEQEGLPSISYRISSDYGTVEIARSAGSQNDDLFGPTMNICSKINSRASPGGIVIGEGLSKVIRSLSLLSKAGKNYYYELRELAPIEDLMIGLNKYPLYALKRNDSDRNLIQTQPKLDRQQQQHQRPQELYSGSILLVDDQEDILYTFKTGLTFEGYNVETFEDPVEALKRFAEVDPSYYDLVILDIRMPGLNGLQLYYRLKAINRNIKVLFVSALDAVPELISIMPGVRSADDILRKPVPIPDLVKTVKKVLSQ